MTPRSEVNESKFYIYNGMSTSQGTRACEQAIRLKDAGQITSTAHTDSEPTDGGGENGGEGNVVMKASRSEAARAAVRADESNLPHF